MEASRAGSALRFLVILIAVGACIAGGAYAQEAVPPGARTLTRISG